MCGGEGGVNDLLDVIAEEDKVDAAEAELSDNQEQVHRLSEKHRGNLS